MEYVIITGGHVVDATKLSERKHWLWGKQWLMAWHYRKLDRQGNVLLRNTKCKWFNPKDVFEVTSEANK